MLGRNGSIGHAAAIFKSLWEVLEADIARRWPGSGCPVSQLVDASVYVLGGGLARRLSNLQVACTHQDSACTPPSFSLSNIDDAPRQRHRSW